MSADAHPPAPQPADASAPPAAPKRLPLLWIICVLSGLGGMLSAAMAFSATPVWAAISAAFAVLGLGIAVTLWLRLRVGWWAAIVLIGLIGVNYAPTVPSGLFGPDAEPGWFFLRSLPLVAVAVYLWIRRRHFGRRDVQPRRVLSAAGISALAVVLLLGGCPALLLTVDDMRRSFPALEVQAPVPSEDENAYLAIEKMRERWPLEDDEQLENARHGLPEGAELPAPEWLEDARAIVQRYDECLAAARQLVRMPHCVKVPRIQGIAWVSDTTDWLFFGRLLACLLAMSAQLEAVGEDWSGALDEADCIIALGALIGKESDGTMQTLVGFALTQRGLSGLRSVAARVPDPAVLRPRLRELVSESELRSGFNRGLAGEFQGTISVVEDIRKGGPEAFALATDLNLNYSGSHLAEIPLMKKNMTRNLIGGRMSPYVIEGDTYAPRPPDPLMEGVGYRDLARKMGYLHFARNAVGDMLVSILMPAEQRLHREYFVSLAHARMTLVFLALRCYQLEHGKLPEELEALAPEYLAAIPLDPFTGKTFGYEPGGEKPRIWSAGPDQRTDPPDAERGDDVVIEIEFAPAPAAE